MITAFTTSSHDLQKLATSSTPATLAWARGDSAPEDASVAVCVLPGTELSFANEVKLRRLWPWNKNVIKHKTAIFRQIDQDNRVAHHDALEFPDGRMILLTFLAEGQQATVLQLPVAAAGSKAPQRAAYV